MHLQRGQRQYRMPWPDNPSGFYYWTNQTYWDLDNPPAVNSSQFWAAQFFVNTLGDFVEENRIRIFDPALSGNVILEASLFNENCNYPIETGYSPFDTVLMHWLVGGRRVGYNRLRIPVQVSDQIDGQLHPDLRNQIYANASFYLLNGKACSREGEPIEDFEVDPMVRMWQFRHGTKRRERKVFGPP